MIVLRAAIIVVGVGLLAPGLVGVFRPERLAEFIALTPESPMGVGALRVLIGAPYLAMSAVTIYAVVRRQWALLGPIAAIEGAMAAIRIYSGLIDGVGTEHVAFFAQLFLELIVCGVLSVGALLLGKREGQRQHS